MTDQNQQLRDQNTALEAEVAILRRALERVRDKADDISTAKITAMDVLAVNRDAARIAAW